jgi:WD40 repeat protein
MTRKNLVKRLGKGLGKKVLPYFMAGALAFLNYGCGDVNEFVESKPEKPEEPVVMLAPVAMLTANPTEGKAPLNVRLDGSESHALTPQSYIVYYHWDVNGDRIIDVTTLESYINHTYEAGEHDPILVVEDSQGQKSKEAKLLEKIVVNEDIIHLDKIAFARWDVITEDNWDQHIYVGDLIKTAAGDTLVNLNRLTQSTQDLEPAWSPDGEKIAFTSNRDGNIRLYIMNADGTEQTILTPNMEHASDSSWSPDGTKIAFSYMDSGFSGIALIDLDYGGLEYLVEELYAGYFVGRPRWSPDGNWITFYTNRDGNMEIYKVEVNNKENQINLTNSPAYDVSPSWSPDGSRIAFVSDPNPYDEFYEAEIYLINPDGSNKFQLTNNSAKDLDPDWSPDGSKLVFARRESPATTQDIWVMNADGTNERKVLKSENHDRFPAWKPKIED